MIHSLIDIGSCPACGNTLWFNLATNVVKCSSCGCSWLETDNDRINGYPIIGYHSESWRYNNTMKTKECEYCGKPIVGQISTRTTYGPRVIRNYHSECVRKAKKRAASPFTIHLGTWTGI